MNAAARLVHQHSLSRHLVRTHLLNRWHNMTLLSIFVVMLSALSIIYVTQTQRVLYADYKRSLMEHDQLEKNRGQLILELSSQKMSSRVQQIAESKLKMRLPDERSLAVVRE